MFLSLNSNQTTFMSFLPVKTSITLNKSREIRLDFSFQTDGKTEVRQLSRER